MQRLPVRWRRFRAAAYEHELAINKQFDGWWGRVEPPGDNIESQTTHRQTETGTSSLRYYLQNLEEFSRVKARSHGAICSVCDNSFLHAI